jgi:tRNA(fMet)-specific endonuclease VapC
LKANGKTAVDTNAIIAYRAGVSEVCRLIKEAELILVPAPVLGELLYGALNSQRIRENQEAIYNFLRYALFIQSDENIAARYASVRHKLRKIGRPIPENDIWIAAACLEFDVPLLTRDAHFENIEGLRVINWMKRQDAI